MKWKRSIWSAQEAIRGGGGGGGESSSIVRSGGGIEAGTKEEDWEVRVDEVPRVAILDGWFGGGGGGQAGFDIREEFVGTGGGAPFLSTAVITDLTS